MKTIVLVPTILLLLPMASVQASPSQFCATQAAQAAVALANVNGTISEIVDSATSQNGHTFKVVLSEDGLGSNKYIISTTGGHDCVVRSVRLIGKPTIRP